MNSCLFCGSRFSSNYKAGHSFACQTLVPTSDPTSRAGQSETCVRGERDRLLIQLSQASQEISALRTANIELMRRLREGGAE